MNIHTTPSIAAADVKEIARSLIPELRSREMQTEQDRKVPAENIRLLQDSGLLGIFRAKRWGGSELSMTAHVDAVSTIAEGCQATAWVLGVYHAHDYIIGHMSEKAQEEIYGTGRIAAVSAVIGPRGRAVRQKDGSYVLTGFWPFASGNAASDWLLLGAEVYDEDGNKLDEGDLAVPASDVESLDDWKVAWDYIHFEGFLGAKMSMQFTWQGNDSALAAPLVLDLARLAAFAQIQGESGLMTHAAAYFKSPADVEEQTFVKQLQRLEAYAAQHRERLRRRAGQ